MVHPKKRPCGCDERLNERGGHCSRLSSSTNLAAVLLLLPTSSLTSRLDCVHILNLLGFASLNSDLGPRFVPLVPVSTD